MTIVVDVAPSRDAIAERAARYFCDTLAAQTETIAVCLAGGDTPRPFYEALTRDPYREEIPWSRIHWFLGDERFVPATDPRSNFRMIHEALFARADIPESNIHAVPTAGLSLDQAAAAYEQVLKDHYGADGLTADKALFDITILGLGPDGHTASLFPGSSALDETQRWAVGVTTPTQPEPRITLTFPVLAASRSVVFLVAGAEKHAMLQRFQDGDDSIPAGRLRPAGVMRAFVDAAAAGSAAA